VRGKKEFIVIKWLKRDSIEKRFIDEKHIKATYVIWFK